MFLDSMPSLEKALVKLAWFNEEMEDLKINFDEQISIISQNKWKIS